VEVFESYLDPELRQSLLQTAFTLSTGYSPIYRSAIEVPGGRFTGLRHAPVRNAAQARWELAGRLGSDVLADDADLAAIWRTLATRSMGKRPKKFVPHDAFSQLSTDELFTIALGLPDGPRVLANTWEWEHHRSQRMTRRTVDLMDRMRLGPEWRSRVSMLTGLCEPENLHLIPPWMHARQDFFAAGFAPDWRKVWQAGEFKTEAFRVNQARMDTYGNAMVDMANHPDLPRAKDVLVAYEPRHIAALLSELGRDEVQRAARRLRGGTRNAWDALVDQLNAAGIAYGMPQGLLLPTRK
jgi:hypothetical protein